MDFLLFLGRTHVLVLHVPIGVILLAVMADFLSVRPRFAAAAQAATLLWGVAAITGILSVATGLMHAGEGGFAAGNIDSHRFYAILTAAGSVVVWGLRLLGGQAVAGLAKAVGVVTLVVMLLTLHYGSRVTHGERFLTVSAASAADRSATSGGVASGFGAAVVELDAETVSLLDELAAFGLAGRAVASTSTDLAIAVAAPGYSLEAGVTAALAALSDRIVELNVSRTRLPEGFFDTVSQLGSLTTLRIDNAGIDDTDLASLASLPTLRVLNLHGNPGVTNAAVEHLRAMPALERAYVWGTSIESSAIESLRAERPELVVQAGTAFPAGLAAARAEN